jgi:hypothetical protein
MAFTTAVLQYIYVFIPDPAEVFLQRFGLLQGTDAPEITGQFLVGKIKMDGGVAGLAQIHSIGIFATLFPGQQMMFCYKAYFPVTKCAFCFFFSLFSHI